VRSIRKQVDLPCFNLLGIKLVVNIDTVFVSSITGVVCCSKAPDVNRYTVRFENWRADEVHGICM
jgi:hypothetical protein